MMSFIHQNIRVCLMFAMTAFTVVWLSTFSIQLVNPSRLENYDPSIEMNNDIVRDEYHGFAIQEEQNETNEVEIKNSSKARSNPLSHRRISEGINLAPPLNASSGKSSAKIYTTIHYRAPSPDLVRGAWVPWPTDPRCRNLTVHFTHAVPPRALASFPGSGNTWARYLVEGATGIHTGSVG
ncbi:uncharacterized protein LOC108679617, partial [Hyalella azteca]|uniref:Uncharacterized protein LOC108679617 n=1 Tax=Hyalella azteca TaxID=294128 RepID=A0A8B7PC73_HYAAZ